MKPLVVKEVRLLLPAYVMALLLALAPVLLPSARDENALALILSLFAFGVVVLALSSFGREFSLRTFSMILAQPMERRRMWWTKIVVLVAAIATLFAVWCLSCAQFVYADPYGPSRLETLAMGGTIVVVAFSGALWTTMLLRQVMAAFWFTVLIPAAILFLIEINHGTARAWYIAMGIYSVAGFALAWWQFNRAQETAWTGGVITLPGWGNAEAAGRFSRRSRRPLAALFWKELQLQQMGLLGMAGLFVVHLGIVWLRKSKHFEIGEQMRAALEVFGGIWFIVPVVNASVSVAEERKLGTMQEILCLPVSRRVQFWIKFVVSLAVSGLLSAALFWTAEGIAGRIGAGSFIAAAKTASFEPWILVQISTVFLLLALAGFYASTLTNGMVQALAAAVSTIVIFTALNALFTVRWTVLGFPLWRGGLIYFISWPVLILTVLWLVRRNFRSATATGALWRCNLRAVVIALVFITAMTTAVYNRAWEIFAGPEPSHGPARLKGPHTPALESCYDSLGALLPDGRLWLGRIWYDPGRMLLRLWKTDIRDNAAAAIFRGGAWYGSKDDRFATGSNWVEVAKAAFDVTGGIRADGTLWVSERPIRPAQEKYTDMAQVGNEAGWRRVAAVQSALIFLKQDGTLWHLGSDSFVGGMKDLYTPVLRRLGKDSDWAEMVGLPDSDGCYAWKKNGEARLIHPPQVLVVRSPDEPEIEPGGLLMDRVPALDNTKWRSISGGNYVGQQLGVRADGTLWHWNPSFLIQSEKSPFRNNWEWHKVSQIGTDTNWMSVAGWGLGYTGLLKTDGTFWMWNLFEWTIRGGGDLSAINPPVRMSRHNDWIAAAYSRGGFVTLAADGSLWYWADQGEQDAQGILPLPRPSRRPSKIENILDTK